jgi:outer membrane immunogenic protein
MMRKSLLLTGVSALALVAGKSAANAADLRAPAYKAPPPAPAPVFSWTGCYAGPHVGWGWSKKDITASNNASGSGTHRGSNSITASGAVYGSQVGCNYQFSGNWVVGVQGDYAATDINGRQHNPLFPLDNDAINSVKIDWLATITGRIGWAVNQYLFYAKGGGAWVHDRWTIQDSINPEITQTRTGWTVGGGIETVIFGNWTVFGEWDYYDFGRKSFSVLEFSGGPTDIFDVKQTMWESKIGVNYKFY